MLQLTALGDFLEIANRPSQVVVVVLLEVREGTLLSPLVKGDRHLLMTGDIRLFDGVIENGRERRRGSQVLPLGVF